MDNKYRGRFAPTPSGDLHLGSLVGALGSFLQARSSKGEWLVRIDDIDTPRVVKKSEESILKTLEAFGLEWDGPILRQSTRLDIYEDALEDLKFMGKVYACCCSRKEIHSIAKHGKEGYIYPGTCRTAKVPLGQTHAYRLCTDSTPVEWFDALHGKQSMNLEAELGDFTLLRGDGIYSYHLSNLIDDHLDKITEIVRGSDLLLSTFRQVYMDQLFGNKGLQKGGIISEIIKEGFQYMHLPLVLTTEGEKLSKQTKAPSLNNQNPTAELLQALGYLGQNPPKELAGAGVKEVLDWAIGAWDVSQLRV